MQNIVVLLHLYARDIYFLPFHSPFLLTKIQFFNCVEDIFNQVLTFLFFYATLWKKQKGRKMSYYEKEAEKKGYFYFHRGEIGHPTPHFHGAVEFLFVRKGTTEVTISGEKRVLCVGDACFSDAFSVHSYQYSGAEGVVLLGAKSLFASIFHSYGGNTPPRFFRFENYELLDTLYSFCFQGFQDKINQYNTFEGSIKILLSAIAENTPFIPPHTDKQGALVCEILRYVDENLASELSLDALSKKFGYSREHLSRILNKHLSENWTAYLNRARIRRAHEILRENPEKSVLQTAWECGFESANTFYRAYKKEFGFSPRKK